MPEDAPPQREETLPTEAPNDPTPEEPRAGRLVGRFGKKKARKARAHPYAHETSPDREHAFDARLVTLVWLLGSTVMAAGGWMLAARYGYINNQITAHVGWESWNGAVLAASLILLTIGLQSRTNWEWPTYAGLVGTGIFGSALMMAQARAPGSTWETVFLVLTTVYAAALAVGFGRRIQAQDPRGNAYLRMAGWILFAAFWALTARDLFVRENNDYVNATAAIAFAVYGVTYFAYHEWLNAVRHVQTFATRFLAIVAVMTAGTYFVIAKISPVRIGLIEMVGAHTNWSLNQFGFGSRLGLQFHIDKLDPWGPVLFHYPDTYCNASRSDPIGAYCATLPAGESYVTTHAGGFEGAVPFPEEPSGFFESLLMYTPESTQIIPVSIILACTAIQSIMLFVGLFMGTTAPLRQKLIWSVGTGGMIYFLNLLRNTLVIWTYGRGHASFFFIHNVVAKVLTLGAMIGIALVAFKRMPAFLEALGSVLDMPHRDGPIERTLNLGRRRPEAPAGAPDAE